MTMGYWEFLCIFFIPHDAEAAQQRQKNSAEHSVQYQEISWVWFEQKWSFPARNE